MKNFIGKYRFYVGFATAILGGGLMLEHYITYGGMLHLTGFDHGTVGLAMVIAGGLLTALKPGQRREK